MPTPALPKRLSLIFLWAEFSRRDAIPIVYSILKTVCIFGRKWGAHSYSTSPKYNKITDKFRYRPPLLVLTCLQCDDKLNVDFEKIIDQCSFALVFGSY